MNMPAVVSGVAWSGFGKRLSMGVRYAVINENVGKVPLTQAEKANRWDHLVGLLKPSSRDDYICRLNVLRRATLTLLACREDLPEGLVSELRAHQIKLDGLWFEAADGWADTNIHGLLNLLPLYGLGSLVGELCQDDEPER